MSEEFDPYLQWLGIREEERPPNHYHLLGLEPGASDTAAIAAAAEATAKKVKLFLQSRHAKRAQLLLAEIKAARAVLVDPASRAQYDRKLAGPPPAAAPKPAARPTPPAAKRARPQKAAPAKAAPPKAAQQPKKAPPAKSAGPAIDVTGDSGGQGGATSVRLRQPRGGKKPWPLLAGGGVAALVLIGLVAAFALSGNDEKVGQADTPAEPPAPVPEENASAPSPQVFEEQASGGEGIDWGDLPRGSDIGERPAEEGGAESQPLTPVEQGEGVIDPSIPAVWDAGLPRSETEARPQALAQGNDNTLSALRAAYAALGTRNVEQAKSELARARKSASGRIDRQELMRLETTVMLLARFWDAVSTQAASAPPGTTIRYGGSFFDGPEVTIVGQGGGMLRLRDGNGWEQDFDVHPARIDAGVALGLAQRGLKSAGGAGLAAQGAFLVLDREGDPTAAERAWEMAAAQAWPIERLEPMRHLDYAQLAVGVPAVRQPVEEVGGEDLLAGGPPWPRPASTDMLAARRELGELFADDLRQATSREQQAELAGQMLAEGRAGRTPALRYAYYFEAKRLAIEAVDAERLFAVVDVIDAEFESDDRDMRLAALQQLTNQQLTGEEAATVMNFLESEIDRLTQAEAFNEALQLTGAARGFARSRGGAAIADRLEARQRWLRRLEEELQPANEAREQLTRFPEDPGASETLGWYLCVFLGDWERGLPYLAKSDNPELSRRAEMDLQDPTDPRTRFDVAKQWHELAGEYASDEGVQAVLLGRSTHWLTIAMPDLPANLQQEAETLLAEINRSQSGSDATQAGGVLANLLGRRWEIVFDPNPQSNHPLADGFRYSWFEFYPDGTCNSNRFPGRWQLQGDLVIVQFEKKPNWRQVYGFTAQGLVVELYDPADTFVIRGRGRVIAQ